MTTQLTAPALAIAGARTRIERSTRLTVGSRNWIVGAVQLTAAVILAALVVDSLRVFVGETSAIASHLTGRSHLRDEWSPPSQLELLGSPVRPVLDTSPGGAAFGPVDQVSGTAVAVEPPVRRMILLPQPLALAGVPSAVAPPPATR